MTDEALKGYRGESRAVLERQGAGVWSDVEIETRDGRFAGIILPRSETADDKHIVLKLPSGYNVGIAAHTVQRIVEHGRREAHYQIPEKQFPFDDALDCVGGD